MIDGCSPLEGSTLSNVMRCLRYQRKNGKRGSSNRDISRIIVHSLLKAHERLASNCKCEERERESECESESERERVEFSLWGSSMRKQLACLTTTLNRFITEMDIDTDFNTLSASLDWFCTSVKNANDRKKKKMTFTLMVHFSEHIQQLHFITQPSSSPGPLLWGLHTTHRIHTFVMMVLFWSWSGETKLGKGGDRSGNIDGCLMTG